MNFIIIIPARFFSSRFPGKLLANIHGKPMIIRVIEQALTSKAHKIIVATDHISILKVVELEFKLLKDRVKSYLTSTSHQSGTERLAEIATRFQFLDDQIIVHLQGDEPLISSLMIHQVVNSLHEIKESNIDVVTLATPIRFLKEAHDSNVVKVVIDINNNALYFSRSIIPWSVKVNINFDLHQINTVLLRHIGIYSYRASFFNRYVKWIKSPLEDFEMLEQLRVLWNGSKIHVTVMQDVNNISVDTPESLVRVNKFFNKIHI